MDLLRMVINKRNNKGDFPESSTSRPVTKGKGPLLGASVRMEDTLYRNDQIIQKREKLTQAVAAFELRLNALVEEVQRAKSEYNVK